MIQQQQLPVLMSTPAIKNFFAITKRQNANIECGTLHTFRRHDKHDDEGNVYQHWGLQFVNTGEQHPETEIALIYDPKMKIAIPVMLKMHGTIYTDACIHTSTGFRIDAIAAETITPIVNAWINYVAEIKPAISNNTPNHKPEKHYNASKIIKQQTTHHEQTTTTQQN